ncbi:MAG TPA: hypothetical protein VJ001_08375 [Rhodocyclaceae bacterium]|nr:hypothetical protein [Rhodocyclaceae bacterium]
MKSARIRRFVLAVGAVLWLSATLFALLTPWGLRSLCWVLEHSFAELRLEQPQGSVLTGFGWRRVEWRGRDLHLRIDALQLDWRVAALFGGRVQLQQASAARAIVYVPSSPTPTVLPTDLVLPLGVDLRRLQLDALYWLAADFDEELAAAAPVAQRLVATLVGDAQGYRLEALHAELAFGVLDAQADLANRAPFALQGEARLQGRGDARVQSRLTARLHGSLSDIGVTLHGQAGTLAMGNGEARVTPFAALPLAQLRLELSDLNPQAFMPQAPQARLRVSADLHRPIASAAAGILLSGHVEAHNAEPRSFDRGGVPLSGLRA